MRSLVYALVVLSVFAADVKAANRPFASGTADTIGRGRWEMGVFLPLRYGLTESLELQTHPAVDVLMPNVRLKRFWMVLGDWRVASRHGLRYPTPLLSALSRRGIGGVLPEDTEVPQLIELDSHALATTEIWSGTLTLRTGLRAGVVIGDGSVPTIDLAVVYPRTRVHQGAVTFDDGVDFEFALSPSWQVHIDLDLFYGTDLLPIAFEQAALLGWQRADGGFALWLGYKLVYGHYPFGEELRVLPLVDAQWGW